MCGSGDWGGKVARELLTDRPTSCAVWGASQPAGNTSFMYPDEKTAFDFVLDHNHTVIINWNP